MCGREGTTSEQKISGNSNQSESMSSLDNAKSSITHRHILKYSPPRRTVGAPIVMIWFDGGATGPTMDEMKEINGEYSVVIN